ncbi:MAG: hypothetical protein M3198_14310 [Actinomycetota bacterium]|nr:hypothetical protein [Actinomycetota bacterium]
MSEQVVGAMGAGTVRRPSDEASIRTVRHAVMLALGEAAAPLTENQVKSAAARLAGLTSTTAEVLEDVINGFVANGLVTRIPGDSRHLRPTEAGYRLYTGLKEAAVVPDPSPDNSTSTS